MRFLLALLLSGCVSHVDVNVRATAQCMKAECAAEAEAEVNRKTGTTKDTR